MPSRNAAALQHHLQHRPLRVAFIHPDLGLGGAERLVVDAAAELAARGHVVDMYTSYYDPARCFDETRTGAFSVLVAGSWFPRHVLGRLHALCAVVRCSLAALYVAWRVYAGAAPPYDVVVVDQVAATVPVLKLLLSNSRVLFYCHFPDMLLTHRASLLKSIYRAPLDSLEQWATGSSDLVLVNSRFTAGVFAATFERLAARGVAPAVLYPAVIVPPEAALAEADGAWERELPADLVALARGGPTFLSINRCARTPGAWSHGQAAEWRLWPRDRARAGGPAAAASAAGACPFQGPGIWVVKHSQARGQPHDWCTHVFVPLGLRLNIGGEPAGMRPLPPCRHAPSVRCRFERKKGIGLALLALHELMQRRPGCNARLIIAGGCCGSCSCGRSGGPSFTAAAAMAGGVAAAAAAPAAAMAPPLWVAQAARMPGPRKVLQPRCLLAGRHPHPPLPHNGPRRGLLTSRWLRRAAG